MGQIVNRLSTNDTNNFIINGDMSIWQRGQGLTANVTTEALGLNTYRQADRFPSYLYRNGSNLGLTFTRQSDAPAGTSLSYSMRAASNYSTVFAATGTQLLSHYQRIEGTTVNQLQPGQDVWVSMYIKCSITANIPIGLMKMNTSAFEEQSYFWNESVVANTWKRVYKKITLPAQAINKGIGTSFYLSAGYCSGTSSLAYNTLPGDAWHVSSNPQLRNASSTNWSDTSGNWLQVTGMMMSDQPHTSFSLCGKNPYDELRLCQRYFQKSYNIDTQPGLAAIDFAGNLAWAHSAVALHTFSHHFSVIKRTAPSITIYSPQTGAVGLLYSEVSPTGDVTASISDVGQTGFRIYNGSNTGYYLHGHYTADAEL